MLTLALALSLSSSVASPLLAPARAPAPAQDAAATTQPVTTDGEVIATLSVRGEAELDKPADEVRLSLGVVTQAESPDTALQENSEQMAAVIEAIQGVGITEDEYETGTFQIHPVYSNRPRNADENWEPRIIAYRVTNTITVCTQQMDLTGDLIAAANEAGANTAGGLSFGLANPRQYRAEAINEAAARARADARALAEASGVELVRVLSVSLDHADPPRPMQMARGRMMAMEADTAAPPIEPGDVTVRATVDITYEIRSQGAP